MKRILCISLIALTISGLATTSILYAHGFGYYGDEDVKADVKKIEKGVQITLTSDDPEIAKDIQENARWYRNIFKYDSRYCPHAYGEGRYSHRRGCM